MSSWHDGTEDQREQWLISEERMDWATKQTITVLSLQETFQSVTNRHVTNSSNALPAASNCQCGIHSNRQSAHATSSAGCHGCRLSSRGHGCCNSCHHCCHHWHWHHQPLGGFILAPHVSSIQVRKDVPDEAMDTERYTDTVAGAKKAVDVMKVRTIQHIPGIR